MKKIIFSLFTITFLIPNYYSQSTQELTINNIKARVNASSLFFDKTNNIASYEALAGSGIHTMFTASLWLAGKDQSGNIKTNVNTYDNVNQPIAGPIMNSNEYAVEGASWDKLWKINCQEIQTFVMWYDAGVADLLNGTTTQTTNFPGYSIPAVITDWPAHGDISKGQAQNLAPYHDRNNDGFYDVASGDYPIIKGDQAIFFMYNDERPFFDGNDTHTPMKTEVHGMVYGYATSNNIINKTVFINYKIYNRSSTNYNDCYLGFWSDMDVGNSADDYVASDVDRSSYYTYNGDNNDEANFGSLGYGSNPAAQAVVFLKGAKQDNDGADNIIGIGTNQTINGLGFGDGIVDNEYLGMEHFMQYSIGSGQFFGDGDPVTGNDYYNYLKGNWRDGSNLVYGGNGHSSGGGTIPTKYKYPVNSDSFSYGTGGLSQSLWSEVSVSNPPGDRTGVGSTGPFTLLAGSSIEIDIALVFGRDLTITGAQAGVLNMQAAIDEIRSQYLNGLTNNCDAGIATGIKNNNQYQKTLRAYPNPFNNEITISYELQTKTAALEIYNLVGKRVSIQKITKNTTVIDLSVQPNGIYFITITDGNNRVSRKIVKQ